jgi:hypothetical protein
MSTDYAAHTVIGLRVPTDSVPDRDFERNGRHYRPIKPFQSFLGADRSSSEVIVTPLTTGPEGLCLTRESTVAPYDVEAKPNEAGPPGDGMIQRFHAPGFAELDRIRRQMEHDVPITGSIFGIWTVLTIC